MRIKKATMKDWPGIKQVIIATKEFGKSDLSDVKEIITTGNGASFVLIDKGKIIGTVSGHWHETKTEKEANVEQIAVLPKYQGKGLGNKLLKKIISYFKSKGDRKVYSSWTKPKNVPFYTKSGFRVRIKRKRSVDLVYRVK